MYLIIEYNQIMCWAHMKRKIDNRVCHIDDIEIVYLSNSMEVFKLAFTLFKKKRNMNKKQANQSILDFLNYFDNEWIQANDG